MFIGEKERRAIADILKEVYNPVKITLFSSRINCEYCEDTEKLMKELVSIDEKKLSLQILNPYIDKDSAQNYGVEEWMVPAIYLEKEGFRPPMRFLGIPSGYEFMTLLEDIIDVSRFGSNGLLLEDEEFKTQIEDIKEKVHIKVFVTPTCPYCPRMVRLAHISSMLNPNIFSEMIEAIEFPELAQRYGVYGVPKTIINEKVEIEGAVPPDIFLQHLKNAL